MKHKFDLIYSDSVGRSGNGRVSHVIPKCSCGWKGTPRRPEWGNGIEVSAAEFRQHVREAERVA